MTITEINNINKKQNLLKQALGRKFDRIRATCSPDDDWFEAQEAFYTSIYDLAKKYFPERNKVIEVYKIARYDIEFWELKEFFEKLIKSSCGRLYAFVAFEPYETSDFIYYICVINKFKLK